MNIESFRKLAHLFLVSSFMTIFSISNALAVCDNLSPIETTITNATRPLIDNAIQKISCDNFSVKVCVLNNPLGGCIKDVAVAIDKPSHHVNKWCYKIDSATNATSLYIDAHISCKASPEGVAGKLGVHTELKEDIDLSATIDSNCKVTGYSAGAHGLVGNVIIQIADFFNKIKPELQKAADKACES